MQFPCVVDVSSRCNSVCLYIRPTVFHDGGFFCEIYIVCIVYDHLFAFKCSIKKERPSLVEKLVFSFGVVTFLEKDRSYLNTNDLFEHYSSVTTVFLFIIDAKGKIFNR